jgi:hypothetical protein
MLIVGLSVARPNAWTATTSGEGKPDLLVQPCKNPRNLRPRPRSAKRCTNAAGIQTIDESLKRCRAGCPVVGARSVARANACAANVALLAESLDCLRRPNVFRTVQIATASMSRHARRECREH